VFAAEFGKRPRQFCFESAGRARPRTSGAVPGSGAAKPHRVRAAQRNQGRVNIVIVGFDEMAAFYEWKPLRAVIPLLMFSACGILFWTVARIILELMMAGKSA
jgi:hypothetical protein